MINNVFVIVKKIIKKINGVQEKLARAKPRIKRSSTA